MKPFQVQEFPQAEAMRGESMRTPDDVSAMVKLRDLGWGVKRIAVELGCSKNTVKRWLAVGGWQPCRSPSRSKKLDGLGDWLARISHTE